MLFVRSSLPLIFIFHCYVCDNEISTLFFRTFSNMNKFNTSYFNGIYPLIKHNKRDWGTQSQTVNFTENCPVIKNVTSLPWKLFDITDKSDIISVNNYLYAKLLESPCSDTKPYVQKRKFSTAEVWIYGLMTVTFINTFAVLGIIFMPLIKKKFYHSLMTFMVSLAVGSLAGTAILILIPDSMKISEMAEHGGFNKHDYKWKATVVFVGLYLFFVTERLFKSVLYKHKGNASDNCSASQTVTEIQLNRDIVDDANGNLKLSEIGDAKDTIKRVDPVAWMIIFGDAMHNFVDGLSIGAAFSYDVLSGISVSVAIMCEELPHELGDFAILISSGMTFKQAIFWNSMSAMTCYLGFIIGVIVGEVTSAAVWIFSIAGGMFLYISLVDMMNDIISTIDNMQCSKTKKVTTFALQNLGLWTGYTIILIVSLYGDQIQFGG